MSQLQRSKVPALVVATVASTEERNMLTDVSGHTSLQLAINRTVIDQTPGRSTNLYIRCPSVSSAWDEDWLNDTKTVICTAVIPDKLEVRV